MAATSVESAITPPKAIQKAVSQRLGMFHELIWLIVRILPARSVGECDFRRGAQQADAVHRHVAKHREVEVCNNGV